MPTAFVTGSTGFLGRHLIDVLLEAGWTVTALVRKPEAAKALFGDRVQVVRGDLTDPTSLNAGLPKRVDCVFHTAADTSTWAKESARQYQINVDGTGALLQATLDKKAKRFVHVSSMAVFGIHEEPVTEKTARLGATSWVSYVKTKAYAERKVKEAIDRGLDAVIVNPAHIVGRYDSHNWARLIARLADGSLPGVPPGGGNFANGRAVAEAVLAAYHKGRTGHSYILGGPYASFRDLLVEAATALCLPEPKQPMPEMVLQLVARAGAFVSKITGKRPMVTPEEAYFACEKVAVVSDKAIAELGYREVPLKQSVEECIAYLKEEKLIDA